MAADTVGNPGTPKAVGVREFRTNLTRYLEGTQHLAIENKGRTVGYYVPALKKATPDALKRAKAAFKRLNAAAKRAGLSEADADTL